MQRRRLMVWLQSLAGAILGLAMIVGLFWAWPRGLAFALLCGLPLGCVFGLQLGGKVLLKQKGLNVLGSWLALITVGLLQLPVGLLTLAILEIMAVGLYPNFWGAGLVVQASIGLLGALLVARVGAKVFNIYADEPGIVGSKTGWPRYPHTD